MGFPSDGFEHKFSFGGDALIDWLEHGVGIHSDTIYRNGAQALEQTGGSAAFEEIFFKAGPIVGCAPECGWVGGEWLAGIFDWDGLGLGLLLAAAEAQEQHGVGVDLGTNGAEEGQSMLAGTHPV